METYCRVLLNRYYVCMWNNKYDSVINQQRIISSLRTDAANKWASDLCGFHWTVPTSHLLWRLILRGASDGVSKFTTYKNRLLFKAFTSERVNRLWCNNACRKWKTDKKQDVDAAYRAKLQMVRKGVFIIPHEDVTLAEAAQTQKEQRAGRDSPLTLQ